MTPVDIDKLKAEASAVSARCRRANSSRQGDPILLRAADLIDSLIAKAERVDALEAVLAPLDALLAKAEGDFTKADELIGGPISDEDGVFVSVGELRAVRSALSGQDTSHDDRHALDAFYAAIPEKFGTDLGGDRAASVAASDPLSDDDRLWLKGIRSARNALSPKESE